MKAVGRHLGGVLLLLSCAIAQNTSEPVKLEDIRIAQDNGDLRIEIVLSSPRKAAVEKARHPDRLLVQFPNTVDASGGKKIEVNSNGVRSIHTVLALQDGTSTNVVIELDHARPYSLSSDGNQTVLLFPGKPNASSQGAMAAASTKGLGGFLHRQRNTPSDESSSGADSPVAAGTAGVLARSSGASAPAQSNSTSAASTPAAASTGVLSSNGISQTATNRGSTAATDSTPPAASSGVFPATGTASTVGASASTDSPQAPVAPVPQSPTPNLSPPGSAGQIFSAAISDKNERPSSGPDGTSQPSGEDGKNQPVLAVRSSDPSLRTVFKVKYVAEGVAYLDGGRSSGLKEGVKLEIQETDLPERQGTAVQPSDPRVVAELEVTALAETSAVTDIHSPKRPVKPGDLAYLSTSDAESLVQQTALSPTRKYPAVVTFTDGDPLDEEARDEVPRPPLPSVNRMRGRVGFDYLGTIDHSANGATSSEYGMIFRGDMTRIGGTYWNLSGYWRGNFTSTSPAGQQTLQDLINRTYHLSMTYDNPNSPWVAGFGRLYLPWASSLDTIDGGYFGNRISKSATLGIFGGSTPDPTSYDYAPGRVISGAFINFEGGDYAKWHYSSTSGGGVSTLNWQFDTPFAFLENTIAYTQRFSIYDALQVDSPSGNQAVTAPGFGLGRNFLTVRFMPHPRVELDFNHTYFRDMPTFDPTLIGTGLLDKYLFQGFSGGARVEVVKHISVYTQLGTSSASADTKSSLNQLYGITFARLPFRMRADVHYASFNSSFGGGSYRAVSVSRAFTDNLTLEFLAGTQSFSSAMTSFSNSRFITTNIETNLGSHYFLQGGYTANRGQFSYDQYMFTIGYRFDSKARHRE